MDWLNVLLQKAVNYVQEQVPNTQNTKQPERDAEMADVQNQSQASHTQQLIDSYATQFVEFIDELKGCALKGFELCKGFKPLISGIKPPDKTQNPNTGNQV